MTLRGLTLAAVFCALSAGAVSAHQGVQNPAVLAWMENMKQMGGAAKLLGEMAKGARAFDPSAAAGALAEIERLAAQSPALFETPQSDPKSEAKPAIWENWADFTAKSDALQDLTVDLQGSVGSLPELRAGMGQLGAACTACHADYRE